MEKSRLSQVLRIAIGRLFRGRSRCVDVLSSLLVLSWPVRVPKHSELEPDHGVAARDGRITGIWDSRSVAAFELVSDGGNDGGN